MYLLHMCNNNNNSTNSELVSTFSNGQWKAAFRAPQYSPQVNAVLALVQGQRRVLDQHRKRHLMMELGSGLTGDRMFPVAVSQVEGKHGAGVGGRGGTLQTPDVISQLEEEGGRRQRV